jgi:hypothetical protein
MSDQNYFLSTNVIGDFNSPTTDNSGYERFLLRKKIKHILLILVV